MASINQEGGGNGNQDNGNGNQDNGNGNQDNGNGNTMLTLQSCDGHLFKIRHSVIDDMAALKNLHSDTGSNLLPVPNVKGSVLAKVIEYSNALPNANKDKFNKEFTDDMPLQDALQMIMAANYLDYKPLLDAVASHIALTYISGKTTEEIRQGLGIKNDFSPEEEAELKLENQWNFS